MLTNLRQCVIINKLSERVKDKSKTKVFDKEFVKIL